MIFEADILGVGGHAKRFFESLHGRLIGLSGHETLGVFQNVVTAREATAGQRGGLHAGAGRMTRMQRFAHGAELAFQPCGLGARDAECGRGGVASRPYSRAAAAAAPKVPRVPVLCQPFA